MEALNIGAVVTGNEFLKGRTEDRFDDRVGKKIVNFGSKVAKKLIVPDDIHQISKALLELLDNSVDLILVTGGLSIDPDDVTRAGIKKQESGSSFMGLQFYLEPCFFTGCLGKNQFWVFRPVFFTIKQPCLT